MPISDELVEEARKIVAAWCVNVWSRALLSGDYHDIHEPFERWAGKIHALAFIGAEEQRGESYADFGRRVRAIASKIAGAHPSAFVLTRIHLPKGRRREIAGSNGVELRAAWASLRDKEKRWVRDAAKQLFAEAGT